MRLIFMGTPEFAVPSLTQLVVDGHDVAAVVTQPDKPAGRGNKLQPSPVKRFALDHGIAVLQPAKIKASAEVISGFERIAPDACIVAAYGKILPASLLAIPRLGCINVHASLLPKYRGAAPINWAIANGERETGVTIMRMDAGMDTGPMLASSAVDIGPTETAVELTRKLAKVGAKLLSETLSGIERGQIEAKAQDGNEATYASMLKREDGLADWTLTATELANRVRGFQPWPGVYTMTGDHRLIIWRAGAVEQPIERPSAAPATIIGVDHTGIIIACSNSTALHIEELQIEGKRRLPARDVANGMRLGIGDRIGGLRAEG